MPVETVECRGLCRINCEFSHPDYEDSIVFPGEDERAHLHMFYGNVKLDHNSTAESLFTSRAASC
jgi:hypothetical protein